MSESTKVRVTIDGVAESFWVNPTKDNEGTVANLLLVGVIGYGDLVTWNEYGEVTGLVKRSGRVNLMLRPVLDEDDLAGRAAWTQDLDAAMPKFKESGIRVEGGLGALILSVDAPELREQTSEQITDEIVRPWLELIPGDWAVEYSVGSAGGDPTDAASLELTVPAVPPGLTVPPEDVPKVTDQILRAVYDVNSRDMYDRLVSAGHINPAVSLDDLIEDIAVAILQDQRAMNAWKGGRLDQVMVLAGRFKASEMGLMLPPLDGYLFDLDFQEGGSA